MRLVTSEIGHRKSGRACPLCLGISDINLSRYCQGIIIDLDAEVTDRAFDLGMPEQELDGPQVAQIVIDRLPGLLAQLKSEWPTSFLQPNRCPIRRVPAGCNILDPDGDDITAAWLAIDCWIEIGQVAYSAFDLKFRPDRPDVSGSQRRLCPR
jgi:hypothetical protein